MVSDYSDAGQERWLAGEHIALLRGNGRLAGPGVVEVDGCHTGRTHSAGERRRSGRATHPRPERLEGVWGNREATSMKAVPHHLVVLGGGPWASRWPRS